MDIYGRKQTMIYNRDTHDWDEWERQLGHYEYKSNCKACGMRKTKEHKNGFNIIDYFDADMTCGEYLMKNVLE